MNNSITDSPAGSEVSVIVVCYNERENIAACLEALLAQRYDTGDYEIVVVDGDSIDGTTLVIEEYAARDGRIRYVREPKKGTASARNTGIRNARFGLVAFTDADCAAPPDWLGNLARAWREAVAADSRVAAVGGPAFIPEGAGNFALAVKIGLNTYLASGGRVSGKHLPRKKFVVDLPTLNVIYEKTLFETIGYFDDGLKSEGEDAEFSYRILRSGRRLLYDPRPKVFHKYRPSPKSWWRNMLRYGRARGTLLVRHPEMLNFTYAAPAILVAALVLSGLGFFHTYFFAPLLYFPLVLIQSIFSAFRAGKPLLAFHVFLAICATHIGYGVGEIGRIAGTLTGISGRR
jgi:glycosyltransferase involved in cell wall biosynthesis